ncbi:MAG: F-box protein [Candidatus Amoebophilus sp.]
MVQGCSTLNAPNSSSEKTHSFSEKRTNEYCCIEGEMGGKVIEEERGLNHKRVIPFVIQIDSPALHIDPTDKKEEQNYTKNTYKSTKRKRPKGNESPEENPAENTEDQKHGRPLIHLKRAKREYRSDKNLQFQQTSPSLESNNLTSAVDSVKVKKKNILDLPSEMLEHICSYLTFKDVIKLKNTNHRFYTYITGYQKPGLVGVWHKPDFEEVVKTPTIEHNMNFKRFSIETIPSFFFYRFVRGVFNFPQAFWPYLQGTQIHTVSFMDSNSSLNSNPEKVQILCFLKYLRETNVSTINLHNSGIEDTLLEEIAEELKNTNVHSINLSHNKITDTGVVNFINHVKKTSVNSISLTWLRMETESAVKCIEALQGTQVHTIYLNANSIKIPGIISIAKDLKKTNMRVLGLAQNYIKDEGAIAFCQNLKSDKLHTLDLSCNNISVQGAVVCIENLQKTNIRNLILAKNNINGPDLKLVAKGLQGTSIDTIDLSYNKIRIKEALEFADNLKYTSVHTVKLIMNNLDKKIKIL